MGFKEIIGQQKPLAVLTAALASGRLHHAYLFVGPEGVGKHLVAIAMAKALHCSEIRNDFCGGCVNCRRIGDGNHPDVRVVEPLTGKKEISIQQIRELEREFSYRSFTGKPKIVVIDPATLLNLSSQNALLKTLEEPPQNSLIVLIAPNEGGLLATLRSRCLRLSFTPVPRQEVAAFLQSQHGMNGADADFLAALGMGSIGATLALDKTEVIEKRKTWTGLLGALKARDYQGAMAAAEALATSREEALNFLKWADSWYRDLLIYSVAHESDDLVNSDMRAQIEQQSSNRGTDFVLHALELSAGAAARIQRNLNRRMVLEKFLFGVVGER